jgi:hypothetical protein
MALRGVVRDLHAEFRGAFSEQTIERLLRESYEELAAKATVTRWLVVGAERVARQRLQSLRAPATPRPRVYATHS